MSALLLIVGFILFLSGAFGLYAGTSEEGELAVRVREALSGVFPEPKTFLIIFGAAAAVVGFVLVLRAVVRARREQRSRAGMSLRVMTVLAMLIAMTVMLDRFPGLSIKTPGWKIGFAFIPPMLAAMLYGPLEGALVYGLSDLIGALLFPFGPYHPGFTIAAALMGFVMGIFLNKKPFAFAKGGFEWKKIRFFPNMLLPVLINALLLGLVVNTYWVSQLYGSKTYWGWFVYRLVEYAILVPVQLVLIPVLLKLCETLKKQGLANKDRRSSASSARLSEISRSASILGLSRITELLKLMNDPQDKLPIVHVAGTNGKGSFCAMLCSILREAGYRVGSFTSPALSGPASSIRIDGEEIEPELLEETLGSIAPLAEQLAEKPTEFEVLTAAAFELFVRKGVRIAVVECGLGGDGDSTNVIASPLLSVITNIQLDHTDRLGSTLAEIASHKAGIIKPGRPVLWGGSDPEADAVIERRAKEIGAPIYRTDHSRLTVLSRSLDHTRISFRDVGEFDLALIGAYQPENAANVLTAVDILRGFDVNISDEAVRLGLENVRWPARFEVVSREPLVIFDGAHNPDGVRLASDTMSALFDKKAALLMGVMADKDYAKYPGLLGENAEIVFCIRPRNPRSLEPQKLAETFAAAGINAIGFDDFADGVRTALAYAAEKHIPLVAMGTLYMYDEFKKAIGDR